MLSSAIDWERIEQFVGFGRPDAPVVFVGMEEGLDAAGDLDVELRLRSTYAEIMDRRDASLGTPGFEALFDPERAPIQKTWRAMAHIMLWRRQRSAPTVEAVRRYIALELGRSSGDALLAELMPYPHPSIDAWLYARFNRFPDRDTYREAILPQRKALLKNTLHQHPRDLVVCYGKADWPDFKDLYTNVAWRAEEGIEVGHDGPTRIVLTKHFADRSLNATESLDHVAALALS